MSKIRIKGNWKNPESSVSLETHIKKCIMPKKREFLSSILKKAVIGTVATLSVGLGIFFGCLNSEKYNSESNKAEIGASEVYNITKIDRTKVISQLESFLSKDSAKTIAEKFDLGYNEYQTEMLQYCFGQAFDPAKKLCFWTFPEESSNSAFDNISKWRLFTENYNIIFFETGSINDLLEKTRLFSEEYGKPDLFILGGHGNPNGMNLSDEGIWEISVSNLDSLKKLGEYLEEDCQIYLNSCATGRPDGLGDKLSKVVKREVIAPPEPYALDSPKTKIELDENGRIKDILFQLPVTYNNQDGKLVPFVRFTRLYGDNKEDTSYFNRFYEEALKVDTTYPNLWFTFSFNKFTPKLTVVN